MIIKEKYMRISMRDINKSKYLYFREGNPSACWSLQEGFKRKVALRWALKHGYLIRKLFVRFNLAAGERKPKVGMDWDEHLKYGYHDLKYYFINLLYIKLVYIC